MHRQASASQGTGTLAREWGGRITRTNRDGMSTVATSTAVSDLDVAALSDASRASAGGDAPAAAAASADDASPDKADDDDDDDDDGMGRPALSSAVDRSPLLLSMNSCMWCRCLAITTSSATSHAF